MKLLQVAGLSAFCLSTGDAFVVSSNPGSTGATGSRVVRYAGDYVTTEGEGKINLKVHFYLVEDDLSHLL
jgi:hypothetical protein